MLLVFVVTFAVIILGQFFLFKNKPATTAPQPSQVAPQPSLPAQTNAPETGRSLAEPATTAAASKTKTAASRATKVATSEAETVVETPVYKITFTNRGAQVKSWILKKYNDDNGHPLDMVNHSADQFGLPLGLFTYDQNLRKQINSALYVSDANNTLTSPGELAYDYDEGGVSVHKSFYFGDSYVISIEASVTQNGSPVQAYPMWPPGLGDQHTGPAFASSKIVYLASRVERLAAKKVSGGNTLRGPFFSP